MNLRIIWWAIATAVAMIMWLMTTVMATMIAAIQMATLIVIFLAMDNPLSGLITLICNFWRRIRMNYFGRRIRVDYFSRRMDNLSRSMNLRRGMDGLRRGMNNSSGRIMMGYFRHFCPTVIKNWSVFCFKVWSLKSIVCDSILICWAWISLLRADFDNLRTCSTLRIKLCVGLQLAVKITWIMSLCLIFKMRWCFFSDVGIGLLFCRTNP